MTEQPRIKVIVITLPEYPDRFAAMAPLLEQLRAAGLPVEIHYGANGKDIRVTDTVAPHLKHLWYRGTLLHYNSRARLNDQPMSAGEFGCAWSHYDVYQRLLTDDDADAYLVLEDDAELACRLETVLEALRHLPPTYDVIRTTASRWYPFAKVQDYNAYYYTFQKRFTNYTTSYLVSKQGARKLLAYMAEHLNVPSDDLLSNFYIQMPDALYYASEPAWFVDPRTQPSSIAAVSRD